ncbi:DNA-binding transcriptional regulator, GntR family [Desulfotomaculum arcticum]|uniref:DNA-binding transcriptional regulator, GntR family n=1 Tax=Desulfotruncus arcticus DSM 17038 TaxID=1121424 RepID=A0A1I2TFD6_9FIRM|nr:GntR family transcriptional regulator [Desulfotruncus arcticus]SFG63600.1 DNA-binding transcriptional regulator, GntR family [Desulfotomaculum arcticum] [Desulfotruncus arcticus DSM 17038]
MPQGNRGLLPVRNRTLLTEQVYLSLKSAIIDGTFPTGERLKEEELAKKMGVSRTPVREAINQLKQEGLVTSLVGGGVKVTEISIEEINDIFDVRDLLETHAAIKAVDNISDEQLKKLEEIVFMSRVAQQKGLIEKIIELNTDFHNEIVIASGNKKIYEIICSMRDYLQAYRRVSLRHAQEPEASLSGHEQIYEAIKLRDKEKACNCMKEHLMVARRLMLEKVQL